MPRCAKNFLKIIQKGLNLGFNLGAYRGLPTEGFVHPDFVLSKNNKQWNTLNDVLRKFETYDRMQTMAFHSDFLEHIYAKDIVSPDSVSFSGSFSENFLDVEKNAFLDYELHLPSNNRNYNKTAPCVSSDKLAYFFKTRN